MRALVFRGPADLRLEDRPDPTPGPQEVLLRITATGICGSDLHGFTGESGRRHAGQIMGHETVGRIESVGPAVRDPALAPGSLATVNPVLSCGRCGACAAGAQQLCERRRVIGVDPAIASAFAELMVAPAANVVVLPATMPTEYGALVEPLAVGYHAAARGQVHAGDRVLVVGGGPIGQACALAARRLGAQEVLVSEPHPTRRALVGALGFAVTEPASDFSDRVREQLGGPADAVLDAVGTGGSLRSGIAAATPGARVVLVGMNTPEITLAAYEISTFERTVYGSFCYTGAEFHATAQWVAAGPPGLDRLVEGRVPLAAAPDTFTRLASRDLDLSKVLVMCNE
jgi:threonine dehydrogenase-like Zn-dependent dehydrogenase